MLRKVIQVEVSEPLEPFTEVDGYEMLHILVRYHGRPIGWASVSALKALRQPYLSAADLREAITQQLGWELVPPVFGQQFNSHREANAPTRAISVVVCTRDRTEQLERCLEALLALDYPNYEIVIVDNAPSNHETANLVANLPVRYVCEKRPGLDWARNRGIAEARHDIIAFTDDDALPDRLWLQAIARAFDEPEIMAVTGLVAPAELETKAQILFEFDYGGMGHGFRRRIIKRDALTTRELLWASSFGVGANMAFRRQLFTAVGLFDVALDVGTPSGGGGDIEMFHRLVAQGYTLVYDPSVLVWHTHRRDWAALRRQFYNNGRGFGAYLLTCMRKHTVSKLSMLRFVVGQWLGWWLLNRLRRPNGFPRQMIIAELLGALRSPFCYQAAQAQAKQIAAANQLQPFPNRNVRSRES